MSRVLAIIGAGEAAIPILKKAREMGVTTVAFGGEDSLGRDLADRFYAVSVFDTEKIIGICKKEKVHGVISSSEITTEVAALIAHALCLPGNDVSCGFAGRNKLRMRERVAQRTTVKQPRFCRYEGALTLPYPVVVKSADACGKRGITLVENAEDLPAALAYAKECASDGTVLAEEYIDGGREFSVECIAYQAKTYIIQITEKEVSGPPHFVEIGHHQPAQVDEATRKAICDCAEQILPALGITCSMAHLELKLKDGCLYFIEVGARAGGDHIADTLVGLSTDFDYYKAAIECSLDCFAMTPVRHKGYAGIYFYCKQNEYLQTLFEQAQEAPWCVIYNIVEGNMTDTKTNCETSAAGYFIYGADHRITLSDARQLEPVVLNSHPKAFELLWAHNKEIGRPLTDEDLKAGIEKFLTHGNAVTILDGDHVVGFLNLYCNNLETLQAYICNVYVIDAYRGKKLSKKLVEKAIQICKERGFRKIQLHVVQDNYVAVNLYKQFGFVATGEIKEVDGETEIEMILTL